MSHVLLLPRKLNNGDLSGLVKSFNLECRNCAPLTPLECIKSCRVYRIKNELRRLREAMDNPDYVKALLNVLKNEPRLHILKAIGNGGHSVGQFQKELRKAGYIHSQGTISEEYLRPLVAVGLASEAIYDYYATTFGGRLTKLLVHFPEFAEKLPANSECHEEALLQSLLSGPKTFGDIKALIPPKSVSRIIKRLRSGGLVKTPAKRDYIFFFKSKRDPNKETFTATEWKIYNAVAIDGISAGRLAKETGLSRRRTYLYLRRLKGKKLVFARRTPKAYGLTGKGRKLASVLVEIQQIVEDTWKSSLQVMQDTALILNMGGLSGHAFVH